MSQRLPRGIRRLFRLHNTERDLDEELSSYFAYTVDELVGRGHTRREAEEEAHRRFGDETRYRHELRAIDADRERGRRWSARVDAVREPVVGAVRSWRRTPGMALGLILVFALGIGANATMYGIVDRLLFSPPAHIADAAQVKRLYTESYVAFMGKRFNSETFSFPEYGEVGAARGFAKVAGFSPQDLVAGMGENAEEVPGAWASGSFFPLLGVKPAIGRFYTEAEDRVGGSQLAVIGYNYWQRKYGGARDVIGRTLDFGYGPYMIVGVAPRGFTGVDLKRVDIWLPMQVAAAARMGPEWEHNRGWGWFQVIARLAPGVTTERAAAEASALHAAAWKDAVEKGEYGKDPTIVVAPVLTALGPMHGSEPLVARLLLGVSLIVLLIACVNVANLMLARTIRRGQEIAVRLALGISRRRLVAQMLIESALLSFAGAAAALLIARWGGAVLRTTLLPDVAWDEVGISRTVLVFVLVVTVLSGVLTGVLPALQATRGGLSNTLRRATAGGISRSSSRMRAGLALLQTALSVVLLFGAGVFVRSLNRVHHIDFGFELNGLYNASIYAGLGSVKREERPLIAARVLEEMARVPGVQHVGAATSLPFHSWRTTHLRLQDVDSIRKPPSGGPYVAEITPGYLAAMGIDVLQGRGFNERDTETGPRVALVNRSMARYFWPGQNALGKCIYVGTKETRCSEVVGVVEDAAQKEVRPEMVLQYYLPLAQKQDFGMAGIFVARVDEKRGNPVRALGTQMLRADPRIRFAQVETMRSRIAPETRSWTLGATMFTIFGVLALIVAAIGLYSVLAFDVAQRTRELGVRAALGASRSRLIRMVVNRSLRVTMAGITIGVIAALLLAGRVQQLLFQVPARDPVSIVAVALLLLIVAFTAGLLPGLRAARVDPSTALRTN